MCGLPHLFSEDITKRVCVDVVLGKADSALWWRYSVFPYKKFLFLCVATQSFASLQKILSCTFSSIILSSDLEKKNCLLLSTQFKLFFFKKKAPDFFSPSLSNGWDVVFAFFMESLNNLG